jgi:hypothetical protein
LSFPRRRESSLAALDTRLHGCDDRIVQMRQNGEAKMNAYYVYIMASKRNGTLYIGMTNNLTRRVWEHKNNVVEGFTEKYNVHQLVWYEVADTP